MNVLDFEKAGKRIRWYRKRMGLSQETLANRIGCSSTHICLIENGNRCVSIEMLVAIANALNVSADELLVDSLSTKIKTTNHAFANQIMDCTYYEKAVLLDILTAAKATLREHKDIR